MLIQQRPVYGREEFEDELRLLLTEGVPEDSRGYPLASAIRKADTTVTRIMSLVDKLLEGSPPAPSR